MLDWAISATTIAVFLAVVCIILVILLKMYHNGMNKYSSKCIHNILPVAIFDLYNVILHESETAEKEIEMKQNEVYGINTRPF
jgi:hypothetical protein